MSNFRTLFLAIALTIVSQNAPPNDLPNPYRTIENKFKLPDGRMWGAISAVDIDKDGRSIWIAERCGGNSGCLANPTVDPIVLFDTSGKLIRSFGAGMLVAPHGIFVDREGNVWVTDYQDNVRAGRGGRAGGASAAPTGPPKGQQVFKFSPDGKLLMTLGTAGGSNDAYFNQPNDVLVSP